MEQRKKKKEFFLVYMKDAHRIRDKGKKKNNKICGVMCLNNNEMLLRKDTYRIRALYHTQDIYNVFFSVISGDKKKNDL